MNTRKLVTGLLVAAVLVALYLVLGGKDDAYTVKAELPNAGGVRENSSVKIAGVPGGTVKKIELTPRDTALITMKLDDGAAPIGKGASIKVRPTDLLGERYIALETGDLKKPMPDGGVIPKSRTELPVELDDVLNTFDPDTRERVKILVNEFSVALGARGKDLASLLNAMPPSLADARQLVTEITNENASLKTLLQRGDSLTAAVEPKKDQLASLIVQADTTLRELAERREKLGGTLDAAPGGLQALNRTLTQLRTASTNLRPASVDLKNVAAPLKDTLDALPGLEDSARVSLAAATTAAPSLTKLGKKATPSLKALTPTLANLRTFSADLTPTLNKFDERTFEDLTWFSQNFGTLGMKSSDNLGHQLGVSFAVNPETVTGVFNALQNNPPVNNPNPDGANPDPAALDAETRSKEKGKGTSSAPSSSAPSTSTSPATGNGASKAPSPGPKTGPLDDLLGGVTGLLGGNAQSNAKPGTAPQGNGLSGLLNSLLGK